ncbi:ankyrin, partial [Aspergillus steynii IBT 23096]
ETALHLAARTGHYNIAELLVKEGANLEARDNDGWVPLYGAAIEGHTHIVELLLAHGAD